MPLGAKGVLGLLMRVAARMGPIGGRGGVSRRARYHLVAPSG